jgi:hypothetical protein
VSGGEILAALNGAPQAPANNSVVNLSELTCLQALVDTWTRITPACRRLTAIFGRLTVKQAGLIPGEGNPLTDRAALIDVRFVMRDGRVSKQP